MAIKQVISQIEQKVDTGNGSFEFVPFVLGPKLKYVSSLLNSNNNNLEEMLLLGTDRIIESYIDENNNEIEVTQFRKDSDNNNYYILTKIDYAQGQSDISVDGTMLDLSSVMTAVNTSAFQLGNMNFVYNNNSLYISPDVFVRESNLKYKKDNEIIDIASKQSIQTYIDDNGIRKKIVKDKITNYL